MTAAPGPQQPDEVRHSHYRDHDGFCITAGCPEGRPGAVSYPLPDGSVPDGYSYPDDGPGGMCPYCNDTGRHEHPAASSAQPDDCGHPNHGGDGHACTPFLTPAQPVRDTEEGRRAPVQATWPTRPRGTVAWSEHAQAAADYMRRFPNGQDAEVLARRGGFDYGELTDHLGHEPRTWRTVEERR